MSDYVDRYEEIAYHESLGLYEDEILFSLMKEYEFLLEQSELGEQQIKRLKEIQNMLYNET